MLFERKFDLNLVPSETKIFENDFVEVNNEKVSIADFKMYEGFLLDEPETSHISGSIINGAFVGRITSEKDGTYFIEPAKRYDGIHEASSIVYHENDVNSNEQVVQARKARSDKNTVDDESLGGDIGCGSTNKNIRDQLAKEQAKITNEKRKKRVRKFKRFSEFNIII